MADVLTISCISRPTYGCVVDRGRPGMLHLAIPRGGPLDRRFSRLVNKLLDQPADRPCLELSQSGGRWLLSGRGQIACAGADPNFRLNGSPLDHGAVVDLDGEYLLSGSAAITGARTYLGIRGEWNLDRWAGSLCPVPGIIPAVDKDWSAEVTSTTTGPYRLSLEAKPPEFDLPLPLKCRPGPEWDRITSAQQSYLLKSTFRVEAASDRQGIRLSTNGTVPDLPLPSLLSAPVMPATVQLTPDGPIVLGPDAQTVGGYARVLIVGRNDDLWQLRAGDGTQFYLADFAE